MPSQILLTRDDFREAVFQRDGHACVLCGDPAQDAHHIMERRLFPDGGYYLDNGASVCGPCHIACEETRIDVETVREKAGIARVMLPPHLYPDQPYDKWGNPVYVNGTRGIGELFHDPSVQKVLRQGGVLDLFRPYVKYPRTWHLPWSPGATDDDRVLTDLTGFEGREVVVTEKMDGENCNIYADGTVHARSIDGRPRPDQAWVRNFGAGIAFELPVGWRACGENLYAEHSIRYDHLPSYFLGFSIWNERNDALSWDETLEWFALLGIVPVPVLWRGTFDEKTIRGLYNEGTDYGVSEGYVVRPADGFSFRDFPRLVAKYVRRDHVRTTQHWLKKATVANALAPSE